MCCACALISLFLAHALVVMQRRQSNSVEKVKSDNNNHFGNIKFAASIGAILRCAATRMVQVVCINLFKVFGNTDPWCSSHSVQSRHASEVLHQLQGSLLGVLWSASKLLFLYWSVAQREFPYPIAILQVMTIKDCVMKVDDDPLNESPFSVCTTSTFIL